MTRDRSTTHLSALARVLTMDGAEVRFRLSSAARRSAAELGYMARRPPWNRAALARVLNVNGDPLIGSVVQQLRREDWAGAHDSLKLHIATRPARFVLDPRSVDARATQVRKAFPSAAQDSIRHAEPLISGCFDLLGYRGLRFSDEPVSDERSPIDWHFDPVHRRRGPRVFWARVPYLDPSCGDHKIIWELNRHQYWTALGRAYWLTGDSRYRDAWVTHLESWMEANPPLTGINWASMLELALRSISWLWALHFFAASEDGARDDRPWTLDLLLGIDRQLTLVEQNLSLYFSPNTHLLGEALALYVVGRSLPELSGASRWETLGRTVLIEQIERQINPDGGHRELSSHYHRYTLDFYLLALAIAQVTQDPAAPLCADAVASLARFARTIADADGRLPCLGDEDGGMLLPICGRDPADVSDSLQIAATLLEQPDLGVGPPAEEVTWMTGKAPAESSPSTRWPSTALLDTGYFVSRSARRDHLIIDSGPHGFLNGGHAHADALALTLSVRGRAFFIDPGTGCYTIDPLVRDRFRSSVSHNTLTLNGCSQSVPNGPFHWRNAAQATALDWRTDADFDYFEGTHDGYGPLVHHRSVLARPGCWIIVDRVLGTGMQRADLHWHLEPSWNATLTAPRRVRAEHPDGTTAWILSPYDSHEIHRGTTNGSGLGWCAPLYGPLIPTTTIRVTRDASAPFALVTVVVESLDQPEVDALPVRANGRFDSQAIAFRLKTGNWNETVMLTRWLEHPGSDRPSHESQMWSAGTFETDARVLCWHEAHDQDGDAPAIVMIDGSVARRQTCAA
jgi:hypothetical protein